MRILGCACLMLLLGAMCPAQETNFPTGPQYLMTSGSPLLARSLATPSLSFETSLEHAGTSEAVTPQAPPEAEQAVSYVLDVQRQYYLPSVFWGVPMPSVVEISLRPAEEETARLLPASITDVGVTEFTDMESLAQRGYGVTLPEAAQRWKSHKTTVPHVYTNSDIERLRKGS